MEPEDLSAGGYVYIDKLIIKEIGEIPRTLEIVKNNLNKVEELVFSVISEGANEFIYTGCGSSYYASLRSSYPLAFSPVKCYALPSSEVLWAISRAQCNGHTKRAVLVFSRSGETAEIKALLNNISKRKDSIVVGFTCNPNSFLAENSDYVIAIKECAEESVYMTKSFTTLSFIGSITSYKILEAITGTKTHDVEYEADLLINASKILVTNLDMPARVAKSLPQRSKIVILATEDLYPLALEASLKFIEVSYTNAIALHALEFRHGYTGLLENPDLVLILLANTNRPSYEAAKKLYNQLRSAGLRIMEISDSNVADYHLAIKSGSHMETLAYIIPLYYLSVYRALNLGYDPDKPKHVVKVVSEL